MKKETIVEKAKRIGSPTYIFGETYQEFEYRKHKYVIEYRNEWNSSAWSSAKYQHRYNQARIDKIIEIESKSNQSIPIDWNEIWEMIEGEND